MLGQTPFGADGAFAALTANGACVTWGSFGAGESYGCGASRATERFCLGCSSGYRCPDISIYIYIYVLDIYIVYIGYIAKL